jgi:hypothetical protein
MAQCPTATLAAADRAVLAVLTGKTLKPVVAVLITVTSTAGCTAAARVGRERATAVGLVALAVFASFGVRDVPSLIATQPKTQTFRIVAAPAMDVKEIIDGI